MNVLPFAKEFLLQFRILELKLIGNESEIDPKYVEFDMLSYLIWCIVQKDCIAFTHCPLTEIQKPFDNL